MGLFAAKHDVRGLKSVKSLAKIPVLGFTGNRTTLRYHARGGSAVDDWFFPTEAV
jgi:hypothetical protein